MRLELDLRDAAAVTQVDKDDAALIADRIDPAEKRHRGVEIGNGELGTMMGAMHAWKKEVFEQADASRPEQAQPCDPITKAAVESVVISKGLGAEQLDPSRWIECTTGAYRRADEWHSRTAARDQAAPPRTGIDPQSNSKLRA
jgi:hypothetical protein